MRRLLAPLISVLAVPLVGAFIACNTSHATRVSSAPGVDAGPPLPLEVSSPWPKFRADAFQDGVGKVHAHTTGGAMWAYPTGKGVFSSPVVGADGTIYVGSADETFYALNPDGTLRWKQVCGQLVDSAGLLDDEGRVYFGSGDGTLRALDAKTGATVWTMAADAPSVNGAYINWFEGNVGIGLDGTLYVPNDNYFVYAVDRDTGMAKWKFKMPDQTWSLPAVDTMNAGNLYVGNNNMVALLGDNTFNIAPDGAPLWSASSPGTVAASPMLTADGLMVVGAFDGFVHAYDRKGNPIWTFATRDHVYASTALLPDGSIVAASADGSVYDIDAQTGAKNWQFDTTDPIRSSPSVDLDGNVYFGDGDGRLYVLGPDGKLRWSLLLIDADRNDVNASPALGADSIYIAGESGQVFSIPYEYCLRPEGKGDPRCTTSPPTFSPGASLAWTTNFGAELSIPPPAIDPTLPITLTLVDRTASGAELAIMDSSKVTATFDPPAEVNVVVSGDGKFVTIVPTSPITPGPDGNVSIQVSVPYLVNMTRSGLALSGGTPGGTAQFSLTTAVTAAGTSAVSLSPVWTITRLSVPLPTIMPSYNQIGFDSLWYFLSLIEKNGDRAVGYMIGGLADASGTPYVDPQSKAIIPLDVAIDGSFLSFTSAGPVQVQITEINLPFDSFRLDMKLDGAGQNPQGAMSLVGSTICSKIPTYGPFLSGLGLCNPQTDGISFVAAANAAYGGSQAAPAGVGTVAFSAASDGVTATLTGSALPLAQHLASVLLVDASTGSPVTMGYALDSVRTAASDGTIAAVKIPFNGNAYPSSVRAYLMVDATPVASATLSLP